MELIKKLTILADGAKYDAACTSSGSDRTGGMNGAKTIGSAVSAGCCHTFSADGRCVSLLKVLMTNYCIYDCKYCVNRRSNDIPRTAFTPRELAELTIQFYRRNYIEGLFLSSGVDKSPDYTMEQIISALELIRFEYSFMGYIHAKTIPGASPALVHRLGLLSDRISINVELPSEESLKKLAPNKSKQAIFKPMAQIAAEVKANGNEIVPFNNNSGNYNTSNNSPRFAAAGQATQMIIGATPESDYQIIKLASALYGKYQLKRVFYSAYIPAVEDSLLPSVDTKPPLLREHRLYQADWLMRQYQFSAEEILSEENPNFNPFLDPKCNWAVNNMQFFPVNINKAPLSELLRVPGIGPTGARKIITARKNCFLGMTELKNIGIVLKRAQFFITTGEKSSAFYITKENAVRALIDPAAFSYGAEQLSFSELPALTGSVEADNEAIEEAVLCLAKKL